MYGFQETCQDNLKQWFSKNCGPSVPLKLCQWKRVLYPKVVFADGHKSFKSFPSAILFALYLCEKEVVFADGHRMERQFLTCCTQLPLLHFPPKSIASLSYTLPNLFVPFSLFSPTNSLKSSRIIRKVEKSKTKSFQESFDSLQPGV